MYNTQKIIIGVLIVIIISIMCNMYRLKKNIVRKNRKLKEIQNFTEEELLATLNN